MFDEYEDIGIDKFIDEVKQGDVCPICVSTIKICTTDVPYGDTYVGMDTLYCPGCGII